MLPLWSPAKCNLGPPHVFRCSRCPAGRVRSVCARICRQTYEQKRLPGRYKRPARPRGRRCAWLSRDRVGAHAAAARRAAPLRLRQLPKQLVRSHHRPPESMIARESHCASFRLYCLLSRPKNHALGKDDVSCDFEDGGDSEPLLGSLDRALGRFAPVRRQSAASQTCGTTIAMSKSTGISAPSLRQAAAGGTGNFEPGSVLFRD